MTPTLQSLDAVLPRVPAGIPALGGDLTDPEDRAVALRWLVELYREAECVKPASPETALFAPQDDAINPDVSRNPGNATRPRSAHVVLDGDTWEVRDRLATIAASNDWPSPNSTERATSHCTHWEYGQEVCCGCARIIGATEQGMPWCRPWLKIRTTYPPAPGITYHDAEEAR